jgi:hypothetical protein
VRLKFKAMEIIQNLQNSIYEIRGQRVLLDKDLSILYDTDTKVLNQAVKRHIDRFPLDFMFQLTKEELDLINLRSQIVTSSLSSENWGGARFLPYAFTEQGVAMLSGIINSKRAVQMNIAIMRAFVELRRILMIKSDFKLQLEEIKERLGGHDAQLSHIYDAIENILDQNAAQNKWNNRDRIGF